MFLKNFLYKSLYKNSFLYILHIYLFKFIIKNQKAMIDIVIMAALFAPSFIFIKIAVQDISPITVIALRIALATILLYFTLKLKGISLPKDWNLWKHCFILGIFVNGPPFL